MFLVFRDRNGGENVTEKVGAVHPIFYVGIIFVHGSVNVTSSKFVSILYTKHMPWYQTLQIWKQTPSDEAQFNVLTMKVLSLEIERFVDWQRRVL